MLIPFILFHKQNSCKTSALMTTVIPTMTDTVVKGFIYFMSAQVSLTGTSVGRHGIEKSLFVEVCVWLDLKTPQKVSQFIAVHVHVISTCISLPHSLTLRQSSPPDLQNKYRLLTLIKVRVDYENIFDDGPYLEHHHPLPQCPLPLEPCCQELRWNAGQKKKKIYGL